MHFLTFFLPSPGLLHRALLVLHRQVLPAVICDTTAFGLLGELAARAVLCDEVEKGPLQHATMNVARWVGAFQESKSSDILTEFMPEDMFSLSSSYNSSSH